jgi:hypothetical protein
VFAKTFRGLVYSAAGMVLCICAWGQQAPATKCSAASISGTYGAVLFGSTSSGVALGYGGQLMFSGKGTFSGAWTTNLNNDITTATVTGSYKVASGCTGSITMMQGSSTINFKPCGRCISAA